jgi:hypothetical protein
MVTTEQARVVLPGRVVVTAAGVHRAPPLQVEVTVFLLALLAFVGTVVVHPPAFTALGSGLVALLAVAVVRVIAYRRHGPLGRPLLALQGDRLVFRLPQDSRGQATVKLADFEHLIVYGGAGRRIFRFERPGAEPVEVRPLWGRALEHGAAEFLRRSLPPACRLTVEEAQTAFATVRGDGPA